MKRKTFLLMLVGLCTIAIGAFAQNVAELRIGNILPLSGGTANDGQQQRRGFDLAVEEINSAGGIKSLGGAKIKMIYADSRGDPQVGMSEAERLVTVEKVHLLVGAFQSAVTLPTVSIAEKYQIPYYVPNATSDGITEQGFKYVFRTQPKAEYGTRDLVQFLVESGVKTVAMAYENTEGGQTFANGVRKWLGLNAIKLVFEEAYPHGAADVNPMINKVKAINPDAFLANSYVQDALLIAKTMRELRFKPKWAIGWGGYADPTFVNNLELRKGWCYAGAWAPDMANSNVQSFIKSFESKYSGVTATSHAAFGFGAVYVIKEVFEKAASTKPDKVRDSFANLRISDPANKALASQYYKGNVLNFDATGQCTTGMYLMGQYQDGDGIKGFKTIWPRDVATVKAISPLP